MRRNTITFINEELYDVIFTNLMCDLGHRISEFNLAKYHAYFALAFSSVLWVRTPRVCVIKDYYRTLKNEPVDFITKKNGKSVVESRVMDLELNCADGQGLIDPGFAAQWAEDMAQDYVPSSFVVRSVFIKGNLVPFDFRAYAKSKGIDKIYDRWGKQYPIDEIDVILSESQFKMYKYYSSWQDYKKYADAADIKWGVARYNRKVDDEFVQANYQYIQTLGIDKEGIEKMIQPTIDWIQKVCSGDELFGLLFALGGGCGNLGYGSLLKSTQSNAIKAVIKNKDFIKDGFIQAKMYKTMARLIEKAKIGKIWVHGNYQFMISDPVAQCESALGLEPKGCLNKDEVWSRFWQDRCPQGCVIDACRSPQIDSHEHNPMKVVEKNAERDFWLQYIQSGVIYNTYDSSTFRHSDSDFDLLVEIKVGERIYIRYRTNEQQQQEMVVNCSVNRGGCKMLILWQAV